MRSYLVFYSFYLDLLIIQILKFYLASYTQNPYPIPYDPPVTTAQPFPYYFKRFFLFLQIFLIILTKTLIIFTIPINRNNVIRQLKY